MSRFRIRIPVLLSLFAFAALPVMAQTMGWYHIDTKEEDNVIKRVLKDNQVENRFHESYKQLIMAAFDEMWRTAEKDSLYDWSRVESLKSERDRLLSEEQSAIAQARTNEEILEDWASDEEVEVFERFKEECLKEINSITIAKEVERDSLKFVNGWTQEILDKQRDESKRVLNYINTWDGTNSPESEAMLKNFEAMKDEMIFLCEMKQDEYDTKVQRLHKIQKGNQVAQLEQEIINYLDNKPYNPDTSKAYLEKYNNGKNKRLYDALNEHEAIHKEILDFLESISSNYLRLDRPEYRKIISDACDRILSKYSERTHPYLNNIRKVIGNLKESVDKGDLNTDNGFKSHINNAKKNL